MADDQGARPNPEIPLPIRVIRSGKIVYHVGSLADLATLAATDKLSPIDEIDGLQPGNPIDLYAVPEIARALAEREEYWLRRNGRAYTIGAMFYGLPFLIFIGLNVRKWWAGEIENGEYQVLLFIVFVLVMNLVVPLVQTVRRRQRLQQLRRSDALVEAVPGRDDRLLATHLGGGITASDRPWSARCWRSSGHGSSVWPSATSASWNSSPRSMSGSSRGRSGAS